jgi:hypothetical protein
MQQQLKELELACFKGTISDNENPIFLFSLADKKNLLAILNGELDVKELVRYELQNRGLNEYGRFVGFH